MFKMKIYLHDIKVNNYTTIITNKGDNIFGSKKIINENWILTTDGKYKIQDNNYFKYKLQEKESIIINNYINHLSIFCENSYFKKQQQVFNIPPSHININIQKYIYNRDPSISLVVEKVNDDFTDIYFQSNNDIQNPDIKNTIVSFLSILT